VGSDKRLVAYATLVIGGLGPIGTTADGICSKSLDRTRLAARHSAWVASGPSLGDTVVFALLWCSSGLILLLELGYSFFSVRDRAIYDFSGVMFREY